MIKDVLLVSMGFREACNGALINHQHVVTAYLSASLRSNMCCLSAWVRVLTYTWLTCYVQLLVMALAAAAWLLGSSLHHSPPLAVLCGWQPSLCLCTSTSTSTSHSDLIPHTPTLTRPDRHADRQNRDDPLPRTLKLTRQHLCTTSRLC